MTGETSQTVEESSVGKLRLRTHSSSSSSSSSSVGKDHKNNRKTLSESPNARKKSGIIIFGAVGLVGVLVCYLSLSSVTSLYHQHATHRMAVEHDFIPGATFPQASEYISTSDASSSSSKVKMHVVFSTDCSTFLHWQSYLLFYSALRVGQPGHVTRIASGCQGKHERQRVQAWHDTHVRDAMSERFHIHFTPTFTNKKKYGGQNYKYSNKPHGLKHWMEHGSGLTIDSKSKQVLDDNVVIVLIDPDMVLLKPFGVHYDHIKMQSTKAHSKSNSKYTFTRYTTILQPNQPIAQRYGYRGEWLRYDLTYITSDPHTPALHTSPTSATRDYTVGPPYIAYAQDMYKIAFSWSEFVRKTVQVDEGKDILSEMYAYSIAAAHHQLKHEVLRSLMVSDPVSPPNEEGWGYIKEIPTEEVCEYVATFGQKHSTTGTAVKRRTMAEGGAHQEQDYPLPYVMHYCQGYKIGPSQFTKYRFPHNFFSCQSPLLTVPPSDISTDSSKYQYRMRLTGEDSPESYQPLSVKRSKREVFMVCGLTSVVNEAGEFFKRRHCEGEEVEGETRWDKSLNISKMPIHF